MSKQKKQTGGPKPKIQTAIEGRYKGPMPPALNYLFVKTQALCWNVIEGKVDRKQAEELILTLNIYKDWQFNKYGTIPKKVAKGITFQTLSENEIVRHTDRGKKVLDSARAGHIGSYGTSEDKQKRYRSYQQAIEAYRKQNPACSYNCACDRIARHYGVSEKTIKRHTKRPK